MAKKKEMNRTSGTARRKISQAEQVRYGMKTGAPLTGSASGVKSISLKQAGEALTQGIVTARGGKLKFAPEGLAMALPLGKVAKAAKALGKAGRIVEAAALESRLAAKVIGKQNPFRRGLTFEQEGSRVYRAIGQRRASEKVFPRAPKKGALGDLEFLPGMTKTQAAQKMAYGTDLAKRPTFRTGGAGPRLPEAVKQTGTGFTKFSKGKAPKATRETSAARNKRLNKAYDLPGFDFNPIFKKTRGR